MKSTEAEDTVTDGILDNDEQEVTADAAPDTSEESGEQEDSKNPEDSEDDGVGTPEASDESSASQAGGVKPAETEDTETDEILDNSVQEVTADAAQDASEEAEQQEDAENPDALGEPEGLSDSENSARAVDDIIGASDLGWYENGNMHYTINDRSYIASSVFDLYKDGSFVATGGYSAGPGTVVEVDWMKSYMDESGDYTFVVRMIEDNSDFFNTEAGKISEVSPTYHYVRTDTQLPAPEVRWSDEVKGVVKWEPVENASYYAGQLYKDGEVIDGAVNFSTTEWDYSDRFSEEGEYIFRVKALSSDLSKYANSDWAYSDPLGGSEEVEETLDDILQKDNVDDAVSSLKNFSQSELQFAMQTNEDVQSKMGTLEENYKTAKNVTVSTQVEEVAIDNSRIDILGAALNAQAGQTVQLKISKPADEIAYDRDVYKNMLQFNMDMYVGDTVVRELDIPVVITLPVPAGMSLDKLHIFHYKSDGTYETVTYRKNGDGTVSFTITHFSTFAFAEEADEGTTDPDEPGKDDTGETTKPGETDKDDTGETTKPGETGKDENGTTTKPGKDSASATGSRRDNSSGGNSNGGSTAVQAELWKPGTPDEIRRYACKGNEVVNYTQAAGNAYSVMVTNQMQGPMCFTSFEAVLGDYTIGRTYNICPTGKNVYSMDREIELTIRIPAAIYRADRQYRMICVTKGGQPIILDDLDKNPETITIRTDKFYAFALIYK